MKLTAGATLQDGKYLVNHVLGQGGSSITLKGTLVPLNHGVILKTLPQVLQEQPDFFQIQQQFQQQVNRFARCQHPALVRLIDSFEEDGLSFAVMDYTCGQTLQELIETGGALPEGQAIHYIQQVGSALTTIHQHGLTHDQVSPANIIRLTGSDSVVLVNYGLTEPELEDGQGLNSASTPYRAIGNQLQRSPATDVYSLAATLYFLVTSRHPTPAALRAQKPLVPPRQLQPGLSAALDTAIISGLAPETKLRPQSVATWLALLPTVEKTAWIPLDTPAAVTPVANLHSNGNFNSAPPAPPPPVPVVSNGQMNGSVKSLQTTQATRPAIAQPQVVHPVLQPPQPITQRSSSKGFFGILLLISAIAAAVGLGAGILLRLAAGSSGPGSSFFHSEQAFPTIPDWPTSTTPAIPSTPYSPPARSTPTPIIPSREAITPEVAPPSKSPVSTPEPSPTTVPSEMAPASETTPPASSSYPTPTPLPSVELPQTQPPPEPALPPPVEPIPPASSPPPSEGSSAAPDSPQ